jgi:putative intracellular protease/amidase
MGVTALDWQYYADPEFRNKLANTLKPSQVNPNDYQAIYYAGGHGVVFDFVDNEELQAIARSIYEKGGIVSGVCHGVVALIKLKLTNG